MRLSSALSDPWSGSRGADRRRVGARWRDRRPSASPARSRLPHNPPMLAAYHPSGQRALEEAARFV